MALSKIMKRSSRNKRNICGRTIKSLPNCLLMEVLARVASASFTDLINAKLSCRDFLGAANNDYIFEHVSMEKFQVIPWFISDEEVSFLKRCRESGNAEALFRQGMVEYFSWVKPKSGLEYLKKAAEKGHEEAAYVYGMILVCSGDESQQEEGLEFLSALKSSNSRYSKIKECRRRITGIIWNMWINNNIVRQKESICGHARTTCNQIVRRQGWTSIDDEEDDDVIGCCDFCQWDREVNLFCTMLRKGRIAN